MGDCIWLTGSLFWVLLGAHICSFIFDFWSPPLPFNYTHGLSQFLALLSQICNSFDLSFAPITTSFFWSKAREKIAQHHFLALDVEAHLRWAKAGGEMSEPMPSWQLKPAGAQGCWASGRYSLPQQLQSSSPASSAAGSLRFNLDFFENLKMSFMCL